MGAATPHPTLQRCHLASTLALDARLRGRWLLVRTGWLGSPARVAAFVQPLSGTGEPIGDPVPMRHGRARRGATTAVLFASGDVASLGVTLVGRPDPAPEVTLGVRPLRSAEAAIRLFGADRHAMRSLLGALRRSGGRDMRAAIRDAEAALVSPPGNTGRYGRWLDLFETWDRDELPDRPHDPAIRFLVFRQAAHSDALDATLASLAEQQRGPAVVDLLGPGDDPRAVFARLRRTGASRHECGYVGVLQAGEVLPPHASAVARAALADANHPAVAITDEDRIDEHGRRHAPVFRPRPGRALVLSGTLSRGLVLIRDDLLAPLPPAEGGDGDHAIWADAVRLPALLDACDDRDATPLRIPHVLCSRRIDVETAPAALLATIASNHLERHGLPLRTKPGFPIRLEPAPDRQRRRRITALVPSTLTAAHAERCIGTVLGRTAHDRFDVIVLAAAPELAPAALAVARRLEAAHPNLIVLHRPAAHFNFAAAINQAAAAATGDLLLLLNDDVAPLVPDWLDRMEAWLADPSVGAVGARLLYPDGTIQHAGVVLGLAGLCEHAHRGWPGGDPGHGGRAQLPQDLLAVTGACLLVPASLFRDLGGMDEGFPSAFNDVDLCLRIGERGRSVVLSDATLIHEESRTYGSHWEGERAADELDDIARLRRRWPGPIADDPFYNPNLDLRFDRSWRPAWPPRRPGADLFAFDVAVAAPPNRAAERLDGVAWAGVEHEAAEASPPCSGR